MLQSALAVGKMAKNAPFENSHVALSVDPSDAPSGFESVWSNNPYANFDYRHTWWQKLLEGVGIRTNYDAYKESLALNAREEQSRILEEARQQKYDSASEQVARERAAGINPDLAGNVDAGDSASGEPDANVPVAPSASDMHTFEGFANSVMACFTGGLSLAKSGMDLMQMKNDIERGNIENSKSIFDFAMRSAAEFIPSEMPVDDPDWKERSVQLALESNGNFLNKRQVKAFTRQLRSLYNSAPTQAEQYKSWYEMMTNKQQAFMKKGSSFWDEDEEILMDCLQPVIDAMDEVFEKENRVKSQELDARGAEAAYNEDYFSTADGALAGEVFNLTNKRNKESTNIDYMLNEAMNQIISNLKDRSESNKRGHGVAAAVLLFFQLFRMVNLSADVNKRGASLGVGF